MEVSFLNTPFVGGFITGFIAAFVLSAVVAVCLFFRNGRDLITGEEIPHRDGCIGGSYCYCPERLGLKEKL